MLRINERMSVRVLDLIKMMVRLSENRQKIEARGIFLFLNETYDERDIFDACERYEVDPT